MRIIINYAEEEHIEEKINKFINEVVTMSIRTVLARELSRSNGKARLVKIPEHMRPTAESLKHYSDEVQSQIRENDAMRFRSMKNAGNCKQYRRK